jgi:hypothetical protein
MEQSFKVTLDTNSPSRLLRADVTVASADGNTTIVISTPVAAGLLSQPLTQARAAVLQAAVTLLQEQSRTP